jgi:hypothetical protein
MTIEICLDKYKVIIENDIIYINDKKRKVLNGEIDKLISYTINWKDKYIGNGFESEEYIVKIDNKEYIFKGLYPENFNSFTKYLGELYDRD